jgi:hypothetical protein
VNREAKAPLRGKQRGRNKWRVEIFDDRGGSWKEWNDYSNHPPSVIAKSLRECADRLDNFARADAKRSASETEGT